MPSMCTGCFYVLQRRNNNCAIYAIYTVARGYISQQQYTSRAERMQVLASSVRQWFNEERMRMGHQGNYHKYLSHP